VKDFGFPGVTVPSGYRVAPAGSDPSGGEGNETAAAFVTTGRIAARRSGGSIKPRAFRRRSLVDLGAKSECT